MKTRVSNIKDAEDFSNSKLLNGILRYTLTAFFSLVYGHVACQQAFTGSFKMSFFSSESRNDPPLFWNIQSKREGGKMVMEIQDDMLKKGVSKRVVFDASDSTWTMLMEFNRVKQGTRIHGAPMYRDTSGHRAMTSKNTVEKKIISGYPCKKRTVESELYVADVWYTDEINFDLCRIYRMLSHCGMMSGFVRKGDWFMDRKLKSMVMEVISTKKTTGKSYTIRVSDIGLTVDDTKFRMNGFRISDIPEGQNCGAVNKESEE